MLQKMRTLHIMQLMFVQIMRFDLSSHHTINVEDIPMEKMDLIFTSSILQRDALISKYPDLNISP